MLAAASHFAECSGTVEDTAPATTDRTTAGLPVTFALAATFAAGVFVADHVGDHASASSPRAACVTLELAEHFGALPAVQKRQTMQALTTHSHPLHAAFPTSLAALERVCADVWRPSRR